MVIGFVRAHYNFKHKFNCAHCGNRKCENRGRYAQLVYCDKWTLKPSFLGSYHLMSYFTGITTTTFILTSYHIIRGITLIFLVPLWIILITKLVLTRKFLGTPPHFFSSLPAHTDRCQSCSGTGRCNACKGSGIKLTLLLPRNVYRVNACDSCKGYKICPTELRKIFGLNIGYTIPGWLICFAILIGFAIGAGVLYGPF